MTAVSRLGRQIAEVTAALRANRAKLDMNEVREYLIFSIGRRRSMNSCAKSTDVLAAEGGIHVAPERPDDPYRVLDDLMVVVEQLCPRWPQRDVFRNENRNLL